MIRKKKKKKNTHIKRQWKKLSNLSHEISPKSKHLGYPFNKYALKIFGSKVQSGDDATHQVCYTTNTPSVKYTFFHAHASGCRLWQKLMKIPLFCCCFPKGLFDKDKNSSRIVEWLNACFFVHKWTSCTLSLPIRLRKASLDALATTPKMKAKAAGVLIPEWPAAISWKSNSKVCPYNYAEKRTKGKKSSAKTRVIYYLMWFSPTEILNRFVSSKRLTFSQETIGQCAHICCVLFPHHSIGHPGIIGIPKNHRTAHSSDNLAIDHRSNERIHLRLIHTTALIGRRHDLDHGGINHPRSSPYNFVKMYNIKLMVSSERPTQQRTQKQCDRFWDHQRTNVWWCLMLGFQTEIAPDV